MSGNISKIFTHGFAKKTSPAKIYAPTVKSGANPGSVKMQSKKQAVSKVKGINGVGICILAEIVKRAK